MSNFKPSEKVLNKWTATRKAKKRLGDNFSHPRLFSTVGFPKDKLMFGIAIFIEATTLFVAIFFSGFNPFLIIGAAVLVGLDLWFANLLHKNQHHINKFHCKLELAKYEEKTRIEDSATSLDKQKGFRASIAIYEKGKIIHKILIILIAAIKAFFGFLVLSVYGMPVAIGVPAFFFIAAYIHIEHTGYYFSEVSRRKSYFKEESIYLADVAQHQKGDYEIFEADDRLIEGINDNEIQTELEKAFSSLSEQDKSNFSINSKNEKDSNSGLVVLYGKNQIHKIVYSTKDQKYYLHRWGNIQDDDLFDLIGGAPMSVKLKSFIGYNGLKAQYSDSNIEDAKPPIR